MDERSQVWIYSVNQEAMSIDGVRVERAQP